jgi:hypothetical protein
MAALWTAVTYYKSNILARRPFAKLFVLNLIMTVCLCLFAAMDRSHPHAGSPPLITFEIAVLEPVVLGIVLAGLATIRRFKRADRAADAAAPHPPLWGC